VCNVNHTKTVVPGLFPHWYLATRFVTEVTWRVPLVEEQKLFTLPEHKSSPPDLWQTWLLVTLGSVAFLLAVTLYQWYRDSKNWREITRSEISSQLRDLYSICRCCWNVAAYKWKVNNGKMETSREYRLLVETIFQILWFLSSFYYHDIIDIGLLLARKLLNQGLLVVMLKSFRRTHVKHA
jgi:hypothetical protein